MIRKFITGHFGVNLYLIYDEKSKECAIVDPGTYDKEVIRFIQSKNLKVKYIILTHGHGDHLLGALSFKEKFNADILVHKAEKELLGNADLNFSKQMSGEEIIIQPDRYVKEGDMIEIGDMKWEVIHTPGHTKGGMCLYNDNILLSGDTLFFESIGRFDLFGGDYKILKDSIIRKLMILEDDVIVYPGHGAQTTIGYERLNNRLIR